jgi:hypothetical protein
VFDVESEGENLEMDMSNYKECIKNLGIYSKSANIFILIHKMDKIMDSEKTAVFENKKKSNFPKKILWLCQMALILKRCSQQVFGMKRSIRLGLISYRSCTRTYNTSRTAYDNFAFSAIVTRFLFLIRSCFLKSPPFL